MKAFLPYIALVEDFFESNLKSQPPHGLYDPIIYIMGLGGKRLRPALLMASGELFGAKKEDLIQYFSFFHIVRAKVIKVVESMI